MKIDLTEWFKNQFKDHIPETCWIRTKERLPQEEKLVLARYEHGCHVGSYFDYAFLEFDKGSWYLNTVRLQRVKVDAPSEWVYLHLTM